MGGRFSCKKNIRNDKCVQASKEETKKVYSPKSTQMKQSSPPTEMERQAIRTNLKSILRDFFVKRKVDPKWYITLTE